MSEQLKFRLVDYRKAHPDAKGSDKHYLVYSDDVCCGSIYRWPGCAQERWHWIVNGWVFHEYTSPKGTHYKGQKPVSAQGGEDTREEAMKCWRAAWERLQPDLEAIRAERKQCDRFG